MNNLILLLVTCATILISCSTEYAGGTADTGNAKVAAIIYTGEGKPAAGVSVVCCPVDYLAGIDSGSAVKKVIETTTDDSGFFALDSIDSGEYIIEVNDHKSSVVSFKVGVSDENSPTVSLKDTLKPYAILQGNAGQTTDTSLHRFILIYGLQRRVPVSTDGSFIINDLPEGQFDLRIVADREGWVPVDIDSLNLSSAQTVSIPFAGWNNRYIITLNTTPEGADIQENVYDFPLLIRLSERNFDFNLANPDGSDCIFTDAQNNPLSFEIEQWDNIAKKASIWVSMDTVYGNTEEQTIILLWGNRNKVLTQNSGSVFDSSKGFLACYHFNGDLLNASANMFNGIDSNTIDNDKGVIGRARSFNGSTSYFRVKDLPDRPNGSISFWFRPAADIDLSNAKTQGIWGKKIEDSHNFTLSIQGLDFFPNAGFAGNLFTKLENSAGGEYLNSKTASFFGNVWYFVTWSWGDGRNSLYLNGILENSITDYRPVSGKADDEIGRSLYDASNIPDGVPGYFKGTLDEFRLETKARTASWVKLSYINQRPDQKLITIVKQ